MTRVLNGIPRVTVRNQWIYKRILSVDLLQISLASRLLEGSFPTLNVAPNRYTLCPPLTITSEGTHTEHSRPHVTRRTCDPRCRFCMRVMPGIFTCANPAISARAALRGAGCVQQVSPCKSAATPPGCGLFWL